MVTPTPIIEKLSLPKCTGNTRLQTLLMIFTYFYHTAGCDDVLWRRLIQRSSLDLAEDYSILCEAKMAWTADSLVRNLRKQ